MEITLGEVAEILRGKLHGDPRIRIKGINSLEHASESDISFFFSQRYKDLLKATSACALIVPEQVQDFAGAQIVVDNAELAYAKLASLFAPEVPRYPGISDKAFVHNSAKIAQGVSIYPFVYIAERAEVAEGTILFPGVYIGKEVSIGSNTVIYPNVTILERTRIGSQVIIHAGTVIGSDGFGFVQHEGESIKIPQLGYVEIEDYVELGANCCVDRATFGRTWIKRGVKTDNLVQIGHNVVIGERSIIVSQTGISGSVTVGKQVIIGGQVGIADHITVGDGAMIGSQSGVAKSIPPGEVVSGSPAIAHRKWLRSMGLVSRLPELHERIRTLEKKLKLMEKELSRQE
ncbi:MAG: UDP-3-O-(3-hydroxymyristoyl)glucosamine N-acyltransferase [Deltaproteobacteria bacterium]|nr:MAG: UDP-3-O-(3-hydroxymyristoyl)glucosamine N-acyltransferase [Deltaproteobacteria bacterium]